MSKKSKKTTERADPKNVFDDTGSLLAALVGVSWETPLLDRPQLELRLKDKSRAPELLRYVEDSSAGSAMRSKAASILSDIDELDIHTMTLVLDLLKRSAADLGDSLLSPLIKTVARHCGRNIDQYKCLDVLERIIDLPGIEPRVRADAIKSMANFSDAALVERLLFRRLVTNEEQEAVADVVRSVLNRPFRLSTMSPAGFEVLAKMMLHAKDRKEGHERSYFMVGGPYDGGVDVSGGEGVFGADHRGVTTIFVQCKRQLTFRMADVREFIKGIEERIESAKGMIPALKDVAVRSRIFVTTAPVSREHRTEAELSEVTIIAGNELVKLLNEYLLREYEL